MHPNFASLSAAGNTQTVLGHARQLTFAGKARHHKGSAICNNAPAVNHGTRASAGLDQMRLAAAHQEALSPSETWRRSKRGHESGAGAQQLTRRTG